jgi:hypothetical protein
MSFHRKQQCTICLIDLFGHNEYVRHIRKVHGNDSSIATECPMCNSKFIYTNVKSFIHLLREHRALRVDALDSSPYPPMHQNECIVLDEERKLDGSEIATGIVEIDALETINISYMKMLLKMREGHVLPGDVMKTMALSITN